MIAKNTTCPQTIIANQITISVLRCEDTTVTIEQSDSPIELKQRNSLDFSPRKWPKRENCNFNTIGFRFFFVEENVFQIPV